MVNINDFMFEEIFNETEALAYLLKQEILFLNIRPYIKNPYDAKHEHHKSDTSTIAVFVNAIDLFKIAHAEGVEISSANHTVDVRTNELYRLTLYVTENPKWGAEKFCCWKRDMQPQPLVINHMKKDGAWDKFMESLPKNKYLKGMGVLIE